MKRRQIFAAAGSVALVIGTDVIGRTPLVNAETHRVVSDASLAHSALYSALAPLCTTLDALTSLSLQQHAALLLTSVACVLLWRILRARSKPTSFAHELGMALAALGVWIVVYAGGAVIPRPMAGIRMHNPDDVVIDFHSHTNHSWDGRNWFTVDRNRAWHTQSGFDVAYISDHKSIAGALQGLAGNLPHGGGPTILLTALEARDQYEHIIAIGIDTIAAIDAKGNWHDPDGDPDLAERISAPILILTIPGNIRQLPSNEVSGFARVMAIELSDAAPKGLNMIQRQQGAILRLADSLDLALVAGSDNHGWGSTAVAWSIMRIPGWRALTPSQLDSAIQHGIRSQRRHAGRVYSRDTPDPGGSITALSFTAPLVIWRMLVDLDWPERVSWVCWIVAIVSMASVLSSRAARVKTVLAARKKSPTA